MAPDDDRIDDERGDDMPGNHPRKGVHPLFWLLILLALLAIGWALYNEYAGGVVPAPTRSDAPSDTR